MDELTNGWQGGSNQRQARLVNYRSNATNRAVRYMACYGLDVDQAADKVGLNRDTLRHNLNQPQTKALLMRLSEDFRRGQIAANLHQAVWLRDNSPNHMARLGAIKYLSEPVFGQQQGQQQQPGVVIQVLDQQQQHGMKDVGPSTEPGQGTGAGGKIGAE